VKGITDVSSQLEGFTYTNLQLFPMVITPFLIVWDILSIDYMERVPIRHWRHNLKAVYEPEYCYSYLYLHFKL